MPRAGEDRFGSIGNGNIVVMRSIPFLVVVFGVVAVAGVVAGVVVFSVNASPTVDEGGDGNAPSLLMCF